MKKCFGYVRVSSHRQGEGVSLTAQKDAILRFAAASDITIVKWFEEEQTAAKAGRPVFDGMLKALKSGKASGVVMHKIDRSARNFFDWARIGELADSGIDIHFATETLDFRSRGGRLTANIQMAVAEDYVRNLKAEIHKGQRGQLERGYYPFKAPIGYCDNGKNQLKTIDPVRGPLVRRAFELYGTGQYSLRSLRHEMVRHGLHRASGAPISKGCIEGFLANPFYTGIIRIQRTGEIYQGAHEPLINTELFQRVTDIRTGKGGKMVTRHNHLFRGLFRCGACGRSMIPERQKSYVYYRCQATSCRGNIVRQERLDEAIRKTLHTVRLSDKDIAVICERVAVWGRSLANDNRRRTAAMRLQQFDERLQKLEDAAIDRILDAESFARRKGQLLLERARAREASEKAASRQTDRETVERFLERIKDVAEHYEFADPPEKREIVEIALSNRTVAAKNVSVEPSNWLQEVTSTISVLSGADDRTNSRTSPDMPKVTDQTLNDWNSVNEERDTSIETLIDAIRSPEAERIEKIFMEGYRNAAVGQGGFSPNQTQR